MCDTVRLMCLQKIGELKGSPNNWDQKSLNY
ncbi:MAG: hypothetical protein MRERV_27c028 [Mycoplasmataceae bacterium RV_VA103A]|nr:MAG: hypothetical protein MRERV_27c028 [Mycoplasmataceae bacterium RV_VA103A]